VQDRILRAAATCFRQRGVEGTSMGDIAAAAGLQRPNLYRYFPNKEAVVLAALLQETRAVHAERRARLRLTGPVGPLLVESLVAGQELARGDELIRFAMSGEAAQLTADLVRSEALLFDEEKTYWEPLLAYGRERGELRDDLSDDEIIRWFFVTQFLMFSHEDFFPAEAVRAQIERFVVPAVLADPRSLSVTAAARSTRRSRTPNGHRRG
jgi:AcrR family transcriptional regulator